ncbi:hypothetical protein [Thalassospira alkalitolerans]|uniref:hypothetical protein n=1 Tax=Thalassospira alkalitolerans TaxID=1293890 RepID=UPI003AA8F48B
MHTYSSHPARRSGEQNFNYIGGHRLHSQRINPARRWGEENYFAWKCFQALGLVSPSDDDDLADNSETNFYENQSNTIIKALSDSISIVKSVIEIKPVLEGLIEASRSKGQFADKSAKDKMGAPEVKASNDTDVDDLKWSPEKMIEIHNICTESRLANRVSPNTSKKYKDNVDGDRKPERPVVRWYDPHKN